jgi:HEAT repeat protein
MADILVIDDESHFRYALKRTLELGGHQVRAAADGEKGVAEYRHGADPASCPISATIPATHATRTSQSLFKWARGSSFHLMRQQVYAGCGGTMTRLVVVVIYGTSLLVAANAQESDDDVSPLIAQLGAKDPRVRRRAAKELGRRGSEQAIRALGQALGDDTASVRHEAAIALTRLAPDSPKVINVLIESLKNEDWYVRWQACLALRSTGPPAKAAVSVLLQLACDSDQGVCRESTLALAAIAPGDAKVVATLVGLLDAKPPVDLRAVLFALEASGPQARAAMPWLIRELKGGRAALRESVMRVLRAARPVSVSDLSELLGAPVPAVQVFAARELGLQKGKAKAAIPALVPLLIDPHDLVQRSARDALAKIEANSVALLVSVGESTHGTVSMPGGKVVEQRTERIVYVNLRRHLQCKQLLALLRDRAVGDKILAALARLPLGYMTDHELSSQLEDGSEVKRECAALLLGWLAHDNHEARRRLRAAAGDASRKVRRAIKEALRRLDED